jgi:hypothetical protein
LVTYFSRCMASRRTAVRVKQACREKEVSLHGWGGEIGRMFYTLVSAPL